MFKIKYENFRETTVSSYIQCLFYSYCLSQNSTTSGYELDNRHPAILMRTRCYAISLCSQNFGYYWWNMGLWCKILGTDKCMSFAAFITTFWITCHFTIMHVTNYRDGDSSLMSTVKCLYLFITAQKRRNISDDNHSWHLQVTTSCSTNIMVPKSRLSICKQR